MKCVAAGGVGLVSLSEHRDVEGLLHTVTTLEATTGAVCGRCILFEERSTQR